MRLLEAILDANRRKVAGEQGAGVPVAEVAAALPVAALTCIDARLNRLLPDMLGLPDEQFVWLRNAGNIITSPLSSTMRSLALATAVKGAKEIAIIGHTDCQVGKTTALQLLDRLAALGVDRSRLPGNLVEYFGLFGTERQNVMHGVDLVRASPLIGAKVPVHGLVMDIQTGRVECVANGYEHVETVAGQADAAFKKADQALEAFAQIGGLAVGEMTFPQTKIGEIVKTAHDWLHQAEQITETVGEKLGQKAAAPAASPPPPPKIPSPPGGAKAGILRSRR